MEQRRIPLEALENLRDFGGYQAGSRRLKTGKLYRSASHAMATDADLERLHQLQLAAIVDLRRAEERERQPSRRHPQWTGQVVECQAPALTEEPWLTYLKGTDLSDQAFRGFLHDYYSRAPLQERQIANFQRYFDVLSREDGAVLIHCAAGKDRTGILAALTHHMVGVSREDMVADYLLTNDQDRVARRAPEIADGLKESLGRRPSEEAVAAFLLVTPDLLDIAFEVMASEYGSVEAYMAKALGVDDKKRAAIEDRILD